MTNPYVKALEVMGAELADSMPLYKFYKLKRNRGCICDDLSDPEDPSLFIGECKAFLRENAILAFRIEFQEDCCTVWIKDSTGCWFPYAEDTEPEAWAKAVEAVGGENAV